MIGKAVVTAGVALGGAWVAAIEGTRGYRTQLGMLDTAFQVTGLSTDQARQTFSDLNAVLGDSGQATEAAQHIAQLADNEKELQTWTSICTGVYATFGEALPIDVLQGYVSAAVRDEIGSMGRVLIEQMQILMEFLREIMPDAVRLDTGELVGALTPAVDTRLADVWDHKRRGM